VKGTEVGFCFMDGTMEQEPILQNKHIVVARLMT